MALRMEPIIIGYNPDSPTRIRVPKGYKVHWFNTSRKANGSVQFLLYLTDPIISKGLVDVLFSITEGDAVLKPKVEEGYSARKLATTTIRGKVRTEIYHLYAVEEI